jgi:amino acid permease
MNGLGLDPLSQKSVNIPIHDFLQRNRTLSIQIEEQMQRRDSDQEERMERPRRYQDPGLRPLLVRRHILMISVSGVSPLLYHSIILSSPPYRPYS